MPPDPADLINTILTATPGADYHAAARAALAVLLDAGDDAEERLFEWHRCASCPTSGPCACAGVPYPSTAARAAIDASRGDPRPVAARQAAAALRWLADQRRHLAQLRVWTVSELDELATSLDPAPSEETA